MGRDTILEELLDDIVEIAAELGRDLAQHTARELAEWMKEWITAKFRRPAIELEADYRRLPEVRQTVRRKIAEELQQLPPARPPRPRSGGSSEGAPSPVNRGRRK